MKPLKIAIISVAHIHAPDFCGEIARISGNGAPHAIWDDDPARGAAFAERYHCPFVADLDALLADPAVDAFAICAENVRHLPLLRRALPVGKPTFCEKPLGVTSAEADEIASLVARLGTPLVSGYFQPFFASNRGAAALVASGALGCATHYFFRNAHHAAYGRWFDKPELAWFTDPAMAGGGALLDMGTHAVHLLRHLAGPVREVWATKANLSGTYSQVDDWGTIEMRFSSGAVGRIEAGWCFTGVPVGLQIVGSKASLFDDGQGRLLWRAPNETPSPVPEADARPDRMARLIALVRGELSREEVAEDLAASLDAVRIMDAAYRSCESGCWTAV